jgi:hypothetical protein
MHALTDVLIPGGHGNNLHHAWRREGLAVQQGPVIPGGDPPTAPSACAAPSAPSTSRATSPARGASTSSPRTTSWSVASSSRSPARPVRRAMSTSIRVRPPPGPLSATLTPPGQQEPDQPRADPRRPRRGTSTLRGCLDSEDTRAMLAADRPLRPRPRRSPTSARRHPHRRRRPARRSPTPRLPIDVATAGTAARFLTAVLAASPLDHPRRRQPAHARAPDGGPAPRAARAGRHDRLPRRTTTCSRSRSTAPASAAARSACRARRARSSSRRSSSPPPSPSARPASSSSKAPPPAPTST